MDKKIFMVLLAVVAASGCTDVGLDFGDSGAEEGLIVEEFKVSDDSLSAAQQGRISLIIRNGHGEDLEIKDISLFNTDFLESKSHSCNPPKSQLKGSDRQKTPRMECNWVIEAPEDLDGFESKTVPVKLNLEYESSFKTGPVKVHFKPLEQIEKTNYVEESFTNEEVKIGVRTESPSPFEQESDLEVSVENVGNGNVMGEGYNFSYSPSEMFDCPEDEGPNDQKFLIESRVEFACGIGSDSGTGSELTRNLFLTTHYKYVKQPSLDIRVVNQ